MGRKYLEQKLGLEFAVGIDETNYCTSMAGDCVVCACWLPLDKPFLHGVDDSKRLSHPEHLRLFAEISALGQFTVIPVPAAALSHTGLKLARDRAMGFALWSLVAQLREMPLAVLIDGATDRKQLGAIRECCPIGLHDPSRRNIPALQQVVDGDHQSYLIGAASIVAKVYVDALFAGYNEFWPGYGLGCNHGMMSRRHRQQVQAAGLSPVHRRGYAKAFWGKLMGRE